MPRKSVTGNPNAKATRNITVDADLVDALNARADALVRDFGFRPTISQVLRYLVHYNDPSRRP